MSPAVSLSAALQSIMPAPVLSRRSFTIDAVTFDIVVLRKKVLGADLGFGDALRHVRRGVGGIFGLADVDALLHLALAETVEDRARGEIAIEHQRAGGVVIARDRIGDAVRVAVRVQDRVTGMPSFCASEIAIASLLVSITNSMLGRPPMSRMPPSERSSLSRSRSRPSSSFFLRPELCAASSVSSIVRMRLIEFEIVCQLVSVPPSQRWFM